MYLIDYVVPDFTLLSFSLHNITFYANVKCSDSLPQALSTCSS